MAGILVFIARETLRTFAAESHLTTDEYLRQGVPHIIILLPTFTERAMLLTELQELALNVLRRASSVELLVKQLLHFLSSRLLRVWDPTAFCVDNLKDDDERQ